MTMTTTDVRVQPGPIGFDAHRRMRKLAVVEALCLQVVDRPDAAPDAVAMARETLALMPELHRRARCHGAFRQWFRRWAKETSPRLHAAIAEVSR